MSTVVENLRHSTLFAPGPVKPHQKGEKGPDG